MGLKGLKLIHYFSENLLFKIKKDAVYWNFGVSCNTLCFVETAGQLVRNIFCFESPKLFLHINATLLMGSIVRKANNFYYYYFFSRSALYLDDFRLTYMFLLSWTSVEPVKMQKYAIMIGGWPKKLRRQQLLEKSFSQ